MVSTPDIGVFTQYANDVLAEGPLLNERVRFIMISRIRQLALEEAAHFNGPQMIANGKPLMERMKSYCKEYDAYNRHMDAGWNPVPDMYAEKPTALARKNALEALGVDTKSKR